MATKTATKKHRDREGTVREYREKFAGTCSRAVLRRRVARAKEYIARHPDDWERATVRRIMAGTCVILYPCSECNGLHPCRWHIGSAPARHARRRCFVRMHRAGSA